MTVCWRMLITPAVRFPPIVLQLPLLERKWVYLLKRGGASYAFNDKATSVDPGNNDPSTSNVDTVSHVELAQAMVLLDEDTSVYASTLLRVRRGVTRV